MARERVAAVVDRDHGFRADFGRGFDGAFRCHMDFRPVRVVLTVLDKGEIEATRIAEEVADFLEVRAVAAVTREVQALAARLNHVRPPECLIALQRAA